MAQIIQELLLILKVSIFFGVLHVLFTKNQTFYTSKSTKILALFYFTLYVFMLFEIVKSFYEQYSSIIPMLFIIILDAINTLQMFIINLLQAKNLKKVFQNLCKIDLMFYGLKLKDKRSVFKYTILFIGYTFARSLSAILGSAVQLNSIIQSRTLEIFVGLTTTITLLTEIQFITLVLLVYQRFQKINDALDDLFSRKRYPISEYLFERRNYFLNIFSFGKFC